MSQSRIDALRARYEAVSKGSLAAQLREQALDAAGISQP
jgi:hypothetical protein